MMVLEDFPRTGSARNRSCGAVMLPDGGVYWRVWAPQVDSLQLVLLSEKGEAFEIPMERDLAGYFIQQIADVRENQRYGFRRDGGPLRPDPASRWQPDGVHRPSAVVCPEHFFWTDQDWPGVSRDELVIYELHVGTFTPQGTFEAVIPRLESLRRLGITAIELMPVAQFPGDRDWGYDGVHPFAVQNSYGGPHGLQKLINACHEAKLAVILDVVYNHLGPEGNYFGEFGPYFTDRYSTPWGAAINFDQPGCDGVRAFVLENVRYWVRDFHVDGLRLDAVHAIFDSSPHHILLEIKEASLDEASRLGWPVHIIAESNQNEVRLIDPPDTGCGWQSRLDENGYGGWTEPTTPEADASRHGEDRSALGVNKPGPSVSGGCGLDAVWNDDFHHSVHTLLTGERHGYYMDYGQPELLVKALNHTFVFDGCYSRHRQSRYGTEVGHRAGDHFVISIQNHDQVGNRACGDRFGTLLNPAQQRLAAGLMLLAPHVPLLFMGEEYGESQPFPFFCSFEDPNLIEAVCRGRRKEFEEFHWQGEVPDPQALSTFESAKLSWTWPEGTDRAGMRRLYSDLLRARRHWPGLCDFHMRRATLLPTDDGPAVLRLVRGGHQVEEKEVLVAYFNLTSAQVPLPSLEETGCNSVCLLSSENERYCGSRTAACPLDLLSPYEFQVYGPGSWEVP